MSDDIEALKIHKLAPEKPRKHLHVLGHEEPQPASELGETDYARPNAANEGPIDVEVVRERVIESIKTIFDPEIPVNIYELGLIYDIALTPEGTCVVDMTLTAPACPVAGSLVAEVARKVGDTPGVTSAKVKLVWDPPWSKERMSEDAQFALGLL
jgi:FeS assembly SUF system protein